MTKRSSAASKPAAAKAKPAPAQAASETTEIPAASGADVKLEGAAAPAGGTDAKVSETQTGSDAADPAGTGSAPAASPEETREQAEAPSADRKDEVEEGNQPGETALPPVAGPTIIVTGPANGFRRGGITFNRHPRELIPADFGVQVEGVGMELEQKMRLLAILEEPRLAVVLRGPDGEMEPHDLAELVEVLRAAIAEGSADA